MALLAKAYRESHPHHREYFARIQCGTLISYLTKWGFDSEIPVVFNHGQFAPAAVARCKMQGAGLIS